METWWPAGIPVVDAGEAQQILGRRYLHRFGPATITDLTWWTGWTKTTVKNVLAGLPVEEVDLDGELGIVLSDDVDNADYVEGTSAAPTAALLPALDPTPMGWKQREWLLAVDRHHLFDRAGNIGPTLWWDGEIIGSWAVTPAGEIRTAVVADRGAEASGAIEDAAARLHQRLGGAVVTPAARTPLERTLCRDPGTR